MIVPNRPGRALVLACALTVALPGAALAWEADTTHAGLTEQAAMASALHERLREQLGLDRGLYTPLTVPPADAPGLFDALRLLNPVHGYVPDARGRLLAVGWLAAGAVLADTPPDHAANHFYDPHTGAGLSDRTLSGLAPRVRQLVLGWIADGRLPRSGKPALAWLEDPANPMGVAGFRDQYLKAMTARTPAERERHLAGALLAAGAILHVLQDMASPSHVRDDLAAHLEQIGDDPTDLGSRFERVAALGYGRLGVPAAREPVRFGDLASYFHNADDTGLADVTSASFFSAGTLPRDVTVRPGMSVAAVAERVARGLRRPAPVPGASLSLIRARDADGAALSGPGGVCLARYRLRDERLTWFTDDACRLEQAGALLPMAASYSAGLLDWLIRGRLSVEPGAGGYQILGFGAGFGAGTVQVFWDDASGVRTPLGSFESKGGAEGAALGAIARPPAGARRIAAVFQGVDAGGQPMIAAGTVAVGN